jgi:hypothetical protein
MRWDAERWSRRFEAGATDAERYVRENRVRIAKNDPRVEAAKRAVDDSCAKADLYDALLGSTASRRSLQQQIESLQTRAIPIRANIYERARYEAEWRRECEALIRELASESDEE